MVLSSFVETMCCIILFDHYNY